jgi:hypothetical protein
MVYIAYRRIAVIAAVRVSDSGVSVLATISPMRKNSFHALLSFEAEIDAVG